MFKQILILLLSVNTVLATHCNSATDCEITCSNFKGRVPKPWIAVPWDNGSCYFHNTDTREDRDTLPSIRKEYK